MWRLNVFSRAGLALLGVLAVGGIAASLYPLPVLLVTGRDQVVILRIVGSGDTFHLGFLHSVARSDIWDRFIIDSQHRIVLNETKFQGQGTGIPYGPAEGETFIREGDWFRITGMKRVVPDIYWRIGAEWRNRFQFGTEPEINLSALVGDTLLHVRIEKMSPVVWFWNYAWKSRH